MDGSDSRTTRKSVEAHTNLSMFGAVIALMESGCIYGPTPHKTVEKIVNLCKAEQLRQLRLYDEAINAGQ